jgi:hypothetical protein
MSFFKVRQPLNRKQTFLPSSAGLVAADILGQGYQSQYAVDDSAAV